MASDVASWVPSDMASLFEKEKHHYNKTCILYSCRRNAISPSHVLRIKIMMDAKPNLSLFLYHLTFLTR